MSIRTNTTPTLGTSPSKLALYNDPDSVKTGDFNLNLHNTHSAQDLVKLHVVADIDVPNITVTSPST